MQKTIQICIMSEKGIKTQAFTVFVNQWIQTHQDQEQEVKTVVVTNTPKSLLKSNDSYAEDFVLPSRGDE